MSQQASFSLNKRYKYILVVYKESNKYECDLDFSLSNDDDK